jgi:cytochrome P450
MTQTAPATAAATTPIGPRHLAPRRGLPLVGSALEAWRDPLALFLDSLRSQSMARFRFFYLDYFVVNDPEAIAHVLVKNVANYEKSRNYIGLKTVLGNGLLTSEGDHWRKQRRLAQPAFHREKIAGFAATMARCTEEHLASWSNDASFDAHEQMMALTFRIVGLTLMSRDFQGEASSVGQALGVALSWANDYAESPIRIPPWVPTPANRAFRRAKEKLDSIVLTAIAERRASGEERDDLLGLFLGATDEETGAKMSDQELKEELLTMVLAGHETTANSLAFTLYLLAKNPEVRDALEAQVDRELGDAAPGADVLSRVPLARAVCEESLRLYPPAWVFERQAKADDVVGGHHVPRGAIVAVSPYALHRRPGTFPDPERFDPSRFDESRRKSVGKYDYLPFGGGPRLCIGNAFALMEMAIVLSMIVRRYRVEVAPGFSMAPEPETTLRPRGGVPVTVHPRRR